MRLIAMMTLLAAALLTCYLLLTAWLNQVTSHNGVAFTRLFERVM